MAPKGSVRDSLVSQFDGWRQVIQRREARRPRGIWHTERLGHPAMGLSPMGLVDPRWDWWIPNGMGGSPMGPSRGGGIFPDGKGLSPMGLARQRS